jgi:hypothetical protein
MDDWFDTKDETKKDMRRTASDNFLRAIANDPQGLRRQVLMTPTSDGSAKAELNRFYLRESGNKAIPDSVRVLCVEPDLAERGKLVVFVLPTLGTTDPEAPIITPDWGTAWVAAWPPY